MAYIDNTQTKREIDDAIRGNSVSNLAPSSLAGQVVPVINVNPKDYQVANVVIRGTGTVYTVATTGRFYLTGFNISGTSTTVGDNAYFVTVTPLGGSPQLLARIPLTVTADITVANGTISHDLRNPILLQPGSTITGSASGTIINQSISIFGYNLN